ncbi:hypothetical protein M430DRAFT_244368 [Amorphotheca resinae ATCC 22711]|uniref:Uncharacterized protein n=1 Tax=Amorphotheca resinae ATCC 22711 TaxID=857342 RepID=A0A2T3B2P5_AMORE|nr:hypothetical protein M430DRAFT_244368 [Amorphotheca resinae ATCC 22711]PSS18828.1 hypothetical protein M430DRAFT_244368 [Amorphotheca resinae ATCC 22711]
MRDLSYGVPSLVRENTFLITVPVHSFPLNMILLRMPPPLLDRLTKDIYLYSSVLVPSTPAHCEPLLRPLRISLHNWHR